METEHFNHECSTLPDLAINPDLTNELLLDSEIKSNTKTILESVCNDFESIDVLSSKENKLVLLKKWKLPGSFSENSNDGSDIANVTLDPQNAECTPSESVFISNAASSQTDSIQNTAIDENSQITSSLVVPSLNSQNQASSGIVNSMKNIRTEMVPLQDPSKVGIISDNFTNDKNLSSLAELADAEIVQTSENAVSIIISNPRFIQVLNCKDSGLPSGTSGDITLDSNCTVSEQENLNEGESAPSLLSDKSSLEGNSEKDTVEIVCANEIIYPAVEEINDYNTFSTTPNSLHSVERKRPYYRSRADLRKVAGKERARRVTSKMKAEWQRMLEEKGFLVCPLSGCHQRYRTMANFMTHYKYCYSGMEKNLKTCPLCASVIFSSHKAVLHHMEVEHPDKIEEYKTNFPEPEDIYDCFEDEIKNEHTHTKLDGKKIYPKSLKNPKRKFNIAKENRLSPQKGALKNRIKSLTQPVIENSKLRECGRFDEIVSKISSVQNSSLATQSAERDKNKFSKERECRKRKLILTEHVVTGEKYFEDEPEAVCDEGISDMSMEKEKTEEIEKTNTKSRLVLDMERYKRYTQYLTVTRDFGSQRRTYSRPKSSNVDSSELDSSELVSVNDSRALRDIHQLNSSFESSSISLNENDTLCISSDTCCVSPELSAFDPLQCEPKILKRNSLVNSETDREINSLKKNSGPDFLDPIKERIPCYKAPQSQITVVPSPKIEHVPSRIYKSPSKISKIITYGKIPDSIPSLALKSSERAPGVDFDSLRNSFPSAKKQNSIGNMPSVCVEKSKYNKEDGIKIPQCDSSTPTGKRKRGRPRKDSAVFGGERSPLCRKRVKDKTYMYSKKGRKAASVKGRVNKISSKMHSKLLQKKRMKMGSAKSSLRKAIMYVKRSRIYMCPPVEKRRGRPPHVSKKKVSSLLKNKERKRENTTHRPHDYFSSLKIICENSSVCVTENSSEIHDAFKQKENGSDVSSQQLESKKLPEREREEVAVTSTIMEYNEPVKNKLPILSPSPQPIENPSTLHEHNDSSLTNREENIAKEHTQSASEDPTTRVSGSHHPTSDDKEEKVSSHSPVVVKRSRGRPRKSVTPHKHTKEMQPTKKADEETLKKCAEKPLVLDEFSSPSPLSGPVRKSERVRKRKLGFDEMEDTHKSDEKTKETEKTKIVVEKKGVEFEKTGRRGRPRKIPRIEKDENSFIYNSPPLSHSESKADEVKKLGGDAVSLLINDKGVETEKTPCNPTRPRSRRGRPPRERPEVTHITDICVEEAERDVYKNTVGKKNIQNEKNETRHTEREKIVENNVVEKSFLCVNEIEKDGADSCSPSETRLILPLKKRRKVEKKKSDISVVVCAEIIKMTSDKKDEKICPASLQTSSILPENDVLSKEKDSELCVDKLSSCVEIEACAEKEDKICFPTLKPDAFKVLSNKLAWKAYLEASVSIKIHSTCKWMKMNCFDSVSLDDSKSCMFFTGGPVQSSAFLPLPRSHMDQYIAVASSDFVYNRERGENFYSYGGAFGAEENKKGLIQFWNLGCLESQRLNQLPSMELALEHDHGIVSEMKWCPKGGFCDLPLSSEKKISRLGLLALSCSNSYIPVYSVPDPKSLGKTDKNASIYYTNPSLILTPLFGEPCSSTKRSIATCLDWHQNTEMLAAGYGNGCICVWMLKVLSSTILTVKNEQKETNSLSILPYLVFDGSCSAVTSISFAPLDNCLYLVSSSFDKTLKFFDLRDPSMPFCSIKRGFPLDDCKWTKDFCGASVSLHDGAIFKGSTFAKECGTEDFTPQNISGPVGSLTCSAISNVTDLQAFADLSGTVCINIFHNSCHQIKQPSFDTHVIFETEVVCLDKDNNSELNYEVSSVLNDAVDIAVVMEELTSGEELVRPCLGKESNGNKMPLSTSGDMKKEKRKFFSSPTEGMLHNTLPTLKTQLGNEATNSKKFNISDQLNKKTPSLPLPSNVVISINNSAIKDSLSTITDGDTSDTVPCSFFVKKNSSHHDPIESDCSSTLQNCVESVCDIVPQWIDSKVGAFHSLSASEKNIELKSDGNTVPEEFVESLSSVESICNVAQKPVELEHDFDLPRETFASEGIAVYKSTKSECSVAEESTKSECSVVEESTKSECSVVEESTKSECSVVEESTKSECSVVEESTKSECSVVEESTKSECSVVEESTKSECITVIQNSIEVQLKSDVDSSDISNHGDESDDSFSIISECSYASDSDSCDSIPSFWPDPLVPDTPTISSFSLEKRVALSELSSAPPDETSQPAAEKSVSEMESSVENKVELQFCNEIPITTLIPENESKNCISDCELNQTDPQNPDPPETFDSSCKPECVHLLEGKQKSDSLSVVPNSFSSNESDLFSLETINGENHPTNFSNDSVHMLELGTPVEELASPDLFCIEQHTQYPQTSRQFPESVKGNCNSEERAKKLLLDESPVSYASLISTCGLIFKDVNAISSSRDSFNEKKILPKNGESNVLSSVNAISWNPNYGCHFWLFTAGNSGVCRLICASELIPQENTSLLEKESIM